MQLTVADDYHCDRCDRDVPANDVSRLLHMYRCHPKLFEDVLDVYLDEVARRNNVPRADLSHETEGLGARLTRLAHRASAEIDA